MSPPSEVLSEHLQERLRGRRLVSAVFLTFTFDPGFFDQEVLPVLLDVQASHAVPVRLLQLDDALRTLPGHIAVYYDADGLRTEVGRARLDVQRLPVRQPNSYFFHPKNAFLLVEETEPDEEGHRARSLLVASLSSNLTRSGWWENVEVCHVEEIEDGQLTALKEDLLELLLRVRRAAPVDREEQLALEDVVKFLRGTEQRTQRSTDGRLHTHVWAGGAGDSIPDFLDRVAGKHLRGMHLEVISPYLDDADASAPLQALVERFEPREVRVFLPRTRNGEGACREAFYDSVAAMRHVSWGRLPRELLRLSARGESKERFVHAKVYRFFSKSPARELIFLGSPNLTNRAHGGNGNFETGFLVDLEPARRPDFWLEVETKKPREFRAQDEGEAEGVVREASTDLVLRYHWNTGRAEASWMGRRPSPVLRLTAAGQELGSCGPVAPQAWTELPAELAGRVAKALEVTSIVQVREGDRPPASILVLETGLLQKPPLLLTLSAADILRYWSLLTPAQRAAFVEARAPELALTEEGAELVARMQTGTVPDSLFDRFAGYFHAFACLERGVREALAEQRTRDACYRLFGSRYDSLGTLLDRVLEAGDALEPVDRYVLLLCARQLVQEIQRDQAEFWREHRSDAAGIEARLARLDEVKANLAPGDGGEMPTFLEWFERSFLRRAKPAVTT